MKYYRITMYEGERTVWSGFSRKQAVAKMKELKGAGFANLEEYEVSETLANQSSNPLLTADIAVEGKKPIRAQLYDEEGKKLVDIDTKFFK